MKDVKTRRWLIAFALAFVILSIPSVQAKAAGTSWTVKSSGTLRYQSANGSSSIELYASDIQYLKNELDNLFAEIPD